MKYLITGGGTGGHIYPALAIAEALKKESETNEILYIGTENGLESKLVPRANLDFKTITVKSLPRKVSIDLFKSILALIKGFVESRRILKEYKPDIVIGTGGYVCGPVVFMATLMKVPTVIHEQNAYPGITNKILSRFVDKVLITFDEAKNYFPKANYIKNTGNPIRKEILEINLDKAYSVLGMDKNKKTVLSFGGSGGQKTLNNGIMEFCEDIDNELQVIHVTGERLYNEFIAEFKRKGLDKKTNIKIYKYLHNMAEALQVADLVITPSGAITLSEISALGKASILVPKSYTAENHQEFNARFFEKQGASLVILENELDKTPLIKVVRNLLSNESKLQEMKEAARSLGELNAVEKIITEINGILVEKD